MPFSQRFFKQCMPPALASLLCAGAGLAPAPSALAQTASQEQGKAATSETAQQLVRAASAIQQMQAEPQAAALLRMARGVFVVPQYVRAGVGIAGRGGEGVMLARTGATWSAPLFYNVGGVSIGLQAGVEAGPVVMLLMNDKAVNEFRKENNFSLNAGAGLTLLNYNAKATKEAGRGDVIVWTNTEGAFATAAVGIVDIHFDDSDTQAYYGKPVRAHDVLGGRIKTPNPDPLTNALK